MSVPLTIIIGDERGLTKGRVHQVEPGSISKEALMPEMDSRFVAGIEWKAWGCEPVGSAYEKKVTEENADSAK